MRAMGKSGAVPVIAAAVALAGVTFAVGLVRGGTEAPVAEPAPAITSARLPAATSTALAEDHGPVREGYRKLVPSYLGELTVWFSCAGAGQVTLTVSGIPLGEAGSAEPRELTRATAECGADPVSRTFLGDQFLDDLALELVDAGTAVGRAGFALRLTGDTDAPLSAEEFQQGDPRGALRLGSDAGFGNGETIEPGSPASAGVLEERGRYTLAVACFGLGTLEVRVGTTKVRTGCSRKPERRDGRVDWLSGPAPRITVTYTSTSQAPAHWVTQFIPR